MKEKYLIAHVFLFAFGYSMVSFELPPFLTLLGADQLYLGEMGFLLMLPNIFLPIFFVNMKNQSLVYKFIIISVLITDLSVLAIYFIKSLETMLLLILTIGIGQFIWWITTEIYFSNLSRDSRLINIYSFVWGMAYFISPITGSYLISFIGYLNNLILSFLIILLALILLFLFKEKAEGGENTIEIGGKKVYYESFFPSFASGLAFSIFYSIFPGFLFKNGYSIILLGYVITTSSLLRLIGFFLVINLRDTRTMEIIMKISMVLLLVIILPYFTINFYAMILMAALIGLGSSAGISVPLIYISRMKDSNISRNIAIYELSFGASVSIFSLLFGTISQYLGIRMPYLINSILILFILIIYVSLKNRK
ncbi:MAG: MFS transporter [Thermoplasmata archaeon]|jgi:MFS family permease|nr:MFS transporter [Euryarchaeota archaeon]MVT36396.1 MFS transporter [Euryarchaeota archaeon]